MAPQTSKSMGPLNGKSRRNPEASNSKSPMPTQHKQPPNNARVAKFHDAFEVYNRVMRDEFGIVEEKKGKFKKVKKKDPRAPEPLSVSMKSKFMEHNDGRLEFKTITKIERADGTIDRRVESSIAEPHDYIDRTRIPRNATASYVNPNGRKK